MFIMNFFIIKNKRVNLKDGQIRKRQGKKSEWKKCVEILKESLVILKMAKSGVAGIWNVCKVATIGT